MPCIQLHLVEEVAVDKSVDMVTLVVVLEEINTVIPAVATHFRNHQVCLALHLHHILRQIVVVVHK